MEVGRGKDGEKSLNIRHESGCNMTARMTIPKGGQCFDAHKASGTWEGNVHLSSLLV